MAQVEAGDQVRIHFTGWLNDEVFGTSREDKPIEFVAGSDQMIQGISETVVGMEEGDTKKVTVTPENGFGERDEKLQQRVPSGDMPAGVNVGDRLLAQAGDKQIPVWIREVNDDYTVVDGNHPLAGQTLMFEVELLGIVNSGDSQDGNPA